MPARRIIASPIWVAAGVRRDDAAVQLAGAARVAGVVRGPAARKSACAPWPCRRTARRWRGRCGRPRRVAAVRLGAGVQHARGGLAGDRPQRRLHLVVALGVEERVGVLHVHAGALAGGAPAPARASGGSRRPTPRAAPARGRRGRRRGGRPASCRPAAAARRPRARGPAACGRWPRAARRGRRRRRPSRARRARRRRGTPRGCRRSAPRRAPGWRARARRRGRRRARAASMRARHARSPGRPAVEPRRPPAHRGGVAGLRQRVGLEQVEPDGRAARACPRPLQLGCGAAARSPARISARPRRSRAAPAPPPARRPAARARGRRGTPRPPPAASPASSRARPSR
jgi:hypothetical protein